MNERDAQIEEEFGHLLVGYDDALAAGTGWDRLDRKASRLDADIMARLESVKSLLVDLQQLWPRPSEDGGGRPEQSL